MAKLNRWVFVGIGAVIGLMGGIGVSLTTDLPLAPEIGAVLGACIGFTLDAVLNRQS